MPNLKNLLVLGLITFGVLAGGGGVIYWNMDMLGSYCVEYEGTECVAEQTGYELVDVIKDEGIAVIDAYCAGDGSVSPDPKFVILYKMAINYGLYIPSGAYDLDLLVSDGNGFIYCNEQDYKMDRDYYFSKVVANYDDSSKMTSLETREEKGLFDSILAFEIQRLVEIRVVNIEEIRKIVDGLVMDYTKDSPLEPTQEQIDVVHAYDYGDAEFLSNYIVLDEGINVDNSEFLVKVLNYINEHQG